MGFKAILKKILDESDGGIGIVLMGYDGIAIDEVQQPSAATDVHLLAIEYASVLKEIKRTVGVLKTGELEEISIVSEKCCVIVRGISEDFFVALVIPEDGNFGKGRYLLKRETPRIRESLQ